MDWIRSFWEDFKASADPNEGTQVINDSMIMETSQSTCSEVSAENFIVNADSHQNVDSLGHSRNIVTNTNLPLDNTDTTVAAFESIDYHKSYSKMYVQYLKDSRERERVLVNERAEGLQWFKDLPRKLNIYKRRPTKTSTEIQSVYSREAVDMCISSADDVYNDIGKNNRNDSVIKGSTETRASMRHSMEHLMKEVAAYDSPQRNHILRWILHVVIAVVVAFVALCVIGATKSVEDFRSNTLEWIVKERFKHSGNTGYLIGFLFWCGSSVICVFVSTAVVVLFEPAAAGSGIPSVMSFLNGVMVHKVVSMRTFIAKGISCILSVGGGLPVGYEAPMIHLGAIVGAAITQGRSRALSCYTGQFNSFHSNKDRRDFITAGAACGVSCAFGAPIGGLLFVMEEVASFWDHSSSGQVFLGTMISFTIIAFLNSVKSVAGYTSNQAAVLFEVDVRISLNIIIVFPAAVLGALCGVAATIFTKLNMMAIHYRKKHISHSRLRRLLEPVVIVFTFTSVMYLLAIIPPCSNPIVRDLNKENHGPTNWGTENITSMNSLFCDDSKYSALATLNLGMGKESIRHLFTRRTVDEFPVWSVFTFLVIYFSFACYTNGAAVSSGLVIPMIVIGASIGRLFGLLIINCFAYQRIEANMADDSWMDPGLYALIGAGAFFSGITRLMISICVIMVELSGDLNNLLPIMVAIVMAKVVADQLAKPLYHAQLHFDKVPFLPSTWDERLLEEYTAASVMSRNPITLREIEYTSVVIDTLKSSTHHAFPVVRMIPTDSDYRDTEYKFTSQDEVRQDKSFRNIDRECLPKGNDNPSQKTKFRRKFIGIITREDLQFYLALPEIQTTKTKLTSKDTSEDDSLESACIDDEMTPLTRERLPCCVKEVNKMTWSQWMKHQSPLFFFGASSKTWHNKWNSSFGSDTIRRLPPVIDISIIVNRSPYVVSPYFNLNLTFALFRSIGLRHLVVADGDEVVGIITRKNLLELQRHPRRNTLLSPTVQSNTLYGTTVGHGLADDHMTGRSGEYANYQKDLHSSLEIHGTEELATAITATLSKKQPSS